MTEAVDIDGLPPIVNRAWNAYGDPRTIFACEETSPGVSTNRVFRLDLRDHERFAGSVFVKVSSYGSYVHFRQDHERVVRWNELLENTRYQQFMAPVLCKNDSVFTFEEAGAWVVFYAEVNRRSFLPRVLNDWQIEWLGNELATFHQTCDELRGGIDPTWKSLGSDVAFLYDAVDQPEWRAKHNMSRTDASFLKAHCDAFLINAESLGYHKFPRIPVLIDWNRGNFSVQFKERGFSLYSRWDYDWFRIEPRTLDFYFMSRVVRADGDQSTFSYLVDPMFEPRFAAFLRAYHDISPLSESELLFLKEVYRFFILNYVIRVGEHFFVPEICKRLVRESIDYYLPSIDRSDFRVLGDSL